MDELKLQKATKVLDTKNVELSHDDVVTYKDPGLGRTEKGTIRYNGISDIYEVIALDLQSGGTITNMSEIQKQ